MDTQQRILIVDDSGSARMVLSATLSREGYRVLKATNGVEALDTMRDHEVDMIITDLNMPVMNGIELVSQIRKMKQYRALPIIMLTTESSVRLINKTKSNLNGWVVKPFKGPLLLKSVEKVFEKARKAR